MSHFSPTLEQFLMIAILCIDLLYSCAHHAENSEETDAVFLGDIMVLIIPLVLQTHIKPTLALRAVADIEFLLRRH